MEDSWQQRRIVWLIAASAVLLAATGFYRWQHAEDASRAESRARLTASFSPDLLPPRLIALAGEIRVIGLAAGRSERHGIDAEGGGRFRPGCDALCAALLAMPAVKGVTVMPDRANPDLAARFRIVPRAHCLSGTVVPQEPDRLRAALRTPEPALPAHVHSPGAAGSAIVSAQALDTAWKIRLAARDCIIAEVPGNLSRADLTITRDRVTRFDDGRTIDQWRWARDALPVEVDGVKVVAASGRLLLRRTHAQTRMIDAPRRPSIVGGGAGPIFGWSRTTIANDGLVDPFRPFDAELVLLRHTNLRVGLTGGGSMAAARARLAKAVRDPALAADDPAFTLTEPWIWSLGQDSVDALDRDLLAALIRDRRVTGFHGIWGVRRSLGGDAGLLRAPILDRIADDYVNSEAVGALAALLPKLPPPSADEQARADFILAKPQARLSAKGLVVDQARRGSAAVPLLLRIIADHAAR